MVFAHTTRRIVPHARNFEPPSSVVLTFEQRTGPQIWVCRTRLGNVFVSDKEACLMGFSILEYLPETFWQKLWRKLQLKPPPKHPLWLTAIRIVAMLRGFDSKESFEMQVFAAIDKETNSPLVYRMLLDGKEQPLWSWLTCWAPLAVGEPKEAHERS